MKEINSQQDLSKQDKEIIKQIKKWMNNNLNLSEELDKIEEMEIEIEKRYLYWIQQIDNRYFNTKIMKPLLEDFLNQIETSNYYTICQSIFEITKFAIYFDENFCPGSIVFINQSVRYFEYIGNFITELEVESLEQYKEIIKMKYKKKNNPQKDNAYNPIIYEIPLKDMLEDVDVINMLEETGIMQTTYENYQKLNDLLNKINKEENAKIFEICDI